MLNLFPSLNEVTSAAKQSLLRFPLVLISALGALAQMIYIMELDNQLNNASTDLIHTAMTLALGIPLFFALQLLSERPSHRLLKNRYVLYTAGVVSLWAYWFFTHKILVETYYYQYLQVSLVIHLFAAIAPFLRRDEPQGFWQYNKILFMRSFVSALFAGVLFAGLAVALLGVHLLFQVDIPEELYAELFYVCTLLFMTWFFISGVPQDIRVLNSESSYPNSLRILTQYILVPLVALYMVILYAYGLKMLFNWGLPGGKIAWLTSSMGLLGTLTMLLLAPLRDQKSWIRFYMKGFYILLLPLLAALYVAIYERVAENGITEQRYFLFILTLWMSAVAVYFIVSKSKTIKVVPLSLLIVTALTSFGPWGAYSLSFKSQMGRLEKTLQKNAMFGADGKLQKVDRKKVDPRDEVIISSGIDYIIDNHGHESLKPWLNDSMWTEFLEENKYFNYPKNAYGLVQSLGLQFRKRIDSPNSVDDDIQFYPQQWPISVQGYKSMDQFNWYKDNKQRSALYDGYNIQIDKDNDSLEFRKKEQVLQVLDLKPFIKNLREHHKVHPTSALPDEHRHIELQHSTVKAKIVLNNISISSIKNGNHLESLSGYILISPL